MSSSSFNHVNFTPAAGTPPNVEAAIRSSSSFTILAPPKSDIYAQPVPPVTHDYNAPAVFRRIPKTSFVSAQLTIAGAWQHQFDQGGFLFTLPTKDNPNPDAVSGAVHASHPAWIKAGIETNDGFPCVSIVARAHGGWCDWSLLPLFDAPVSANTVTSATLAFERYHNALKIFLVRGHGADASRSLIRKVPWVFLDNVPELGQDVLVGVYAAQPDPENESSGKSFEVTFSGFQIHTTEYGA
ncbi:hypothetical protein CMQ_4740 [Grosmannia clavigera kw1407]|uniref:Uncharacterized protein n=1 Tax=Grosmannia clavigera (strain kw1407 / UAMH 11150) TaxID=655863 RepID=F0XUI7_GROCL|nr:uncharacterized protein CMQ_4740 [Grosmannia clavigera kw1407]EFW98888.1 hypothetical protein CMQ_4740 [Grosmannia clavigera kw1407]